MRFPESEQEHFFSLRRRAEDAMQGRQINVDDLSSDDIQFLVHELQVHQAELSIQNEELRQMQIELEISRDEYIDLYNFAPVGYCTLDRNDRILAVNQTLAELLGFGLKDLANHHMSQFVARDDQNKYYLYRKRSFENHQTQTTDLQIIKKNGEPVIVRLESLVSHRDENKLMIMVIDITKQREMQYRLVEQREKERQKIAHDLHDGPIQMLSAINFNIQSILMDYRNDPRLTRSLETIQANIRQQIQVLRNYSIDLRPPILSHLGLDMAIQAYIETIQDQYPDIHFILNLHPVRTTISEITSLTLYRIFQEALQNVFKHARNTTEITILLEKDRNRYRMEIRDNGSGFVLPDDWYHLAQQGHLGLIGMRERAETIGGHFEIQTGSQFGTHIKVVVPIQSAPEENNP